MPLIIHEHRITPLHNYGFRLQSEIMAVRYHRKVLRRGPTGRDYLRPAHLDSIPGSRVVVHGVEEVTANKLLRAPIILASQFHCGAEVLNLPRGISFPPRTHESPNLLYCTFGRGTVALQEQQLEVYPGELIHVPALVPHEVGATLGAPFRLLVVPPQSGWLREADPGG